MPDRKPSPALAALSGALSVLPAYAQLSPEQQPRLGYRFSHYSEADLPSSRAAGGVSSPRYDIQTHQLEYAGALNPQWSVDAGVMIESMSGASPWFVMPGAQGQAPVQVMSGASIREERYAVSVSAQHDAMRDRRWSLRLGLSDENDYQSVSAGIGFEHDTDQRRRTWSAGLGYSDDRIRPTDGASETYPERISSADKRSWSAFAGVSQVLGAQTIAQLSLAYTDDQGYLSDPYKLVFVDNQTRADARPRQRQQWALSARVRHYVAAMRSVLKADWRHFRDDWDIRSDTLEVGAWHRIGERLRLGLSTRWYRQSQAEFYGPFFETDPAHGLASSDYRLSPYGALSWRGSLDHIGPRWSVSLAIEAYDSDEDYALRNVTVANPGLVDFSVVSLAFSYTFGQVALTPPVQEGAELVAPASQSLR